MLQILLYFILNFAGFFVFLAIWNRIPKPKPFDYTTIPGLKLNVNTAEEIPDLILKPGTKTDRNFEGHFKEIRKFPNLQSFLDFLFLTYGPLNSFWWSNRYVVTVSSEDLISELKKFRANLVAISPFAIGSYLQGDPDYCTTIEYDTLSHHHSSKEPCPIIDKTLNESVQDAKFMKCEQQFRSSTNPPTIKDSLRQVENLYKNPKNLRDLLSRPIFCVFNEEVWLDAHPIPKYIPIIINASKMVENWNNDELFPKFYSIFYWIPGFHDLKIT
ncbi:unnamed protein product [Caenorhabditis angaria]|uniref:Uncharacterized protein n=1 Tax=Caenorhabditis angaria TaxID=860376 RepID=A0A9P1MYV6_9PELO|nr:unnamed protein product [Caenorhabditis angaria]